MVDVEDGNFFLFDEALDGAEPVGVGRIEKDSCLKGDIEGLVKADDLLKILEELELGVDRIVVENHPVLLFQFLEDRADSEQGTDRVSVGIEMARQEKRIVLDEKIGNLFEHGSQEMFLIGKRVFLFQVLLKDFFQVDNVAVLSLVHFRHFGTVHGRDLVVMAVPAAERADLVDKDIRVNAEKERCPAFVAIAVDLHFCSFILW